MSGCVVKVWFEADSEARQHKAQFSVIETDFPDFESFCLAVDANRFIGGWQLFTVRGDPDEMVIVRRAPIAFRGCAVVRCMLPTWRYVEGEAA